MKPDLRPTDPEQLFQAAFPHGLNGGDSLLRRLRVVLSRGWLDRQLAQGADPAQSGALALRARQLTSRRMRERIADSIDRLLGSVDEASRWSARVQPDDFSVRAARHQLARIAEILHSNDLVYARGVALSEALLSDADSPLYCSSEAGAAWYWAQLATSALEGNI